MTNRRWNNNVRLRRRRPRGGRGDLQRSTPTTTTTPFTLLPFALLLLTLLLLTVATLTQAASDDKCTTGSSFTCPNCDGYEVSDCLDCDGYLNTDLDHDMCIDRKLFQPHSTDENDHDDHYHYLWNDLVGTVVWFLTAGVATACGVGGGGIYVPLGILLFRFAAKPASGLSQASIFGASLGGLILNSRARHPHCNVKGDDPGVAEEDTGRCLVSEDHSSSKKAEKEGKEGNVKVYTRPLVDYDMALFLAPMEMAGAVLGVLVQRVMPNWLYLMIAGCVLSFTSYKTYKKFFATRAKEKEAHAKAVAEAEAAEEEEGEGGDEEHGEEDNAPADENGQENGIELTGDAAKDPNTTEHSSSSSADNFEDNGEAAEAARAAATATTMEPGEERALRRKYLELDARQYPRDKLLGLAALWIGLVLVTFFKGGKGVESLVGIDCESPWYAVLIVFQFLWLFGFALYYGRALLIRRDERVAVRYPYQKDDVEWDKQKLRFYAQFTFVAGIVAGLIGIGGGMVLGPLMLVMGIHPRVSSATTATMIVLTSSSVAVMFVTSGLVPWSYAVFYFFVCLCGALVGKYKIDAYVKRTGRASLLIFILATIIAFATLGCFVIVFTRLAEKDWCFDGFKKFCTVSSDGEDCPVDRMLMMMLGEDTS